MSIDKIFNFVEINENISSSGQPTPAQFQSIADAGFQHIINLAMPDSDNALPEEGSFVSEAGMNYIHIPVPFNAPTKNHLKLFFNLMNTLDGDKIWVHCALNWRVSAFMKHYQKSVLKLPAAKIIPMIESWEPDSIWKAFLSLNADDLLL